MLFDSPVYYVFLAAIVPLYWCLRRKTQNAMLLAASYFFYGWWDWRFLSLILIATVFDFYCAQAIARESNPVRRTQYLTLSLVLNLGFLGYFKYYNFFQDSFIELLKSLGVAQPNETLISVLLPPGISFYTFQAIAYVVDVHDRKLKPSKSLVDYALFISLFPHLIAGPIQRPDHLLPQVERDRRVDHDQFFQGLMLILSGLFRKCVIADNCALLADAAFSGKLGPPSLGVLLIGAYAFAWQIYGDFSGYSQIARGSAKLIGFDFMINFWQPYLATSLRDFWHRWHISLSTWLRDYLYIRLGGSRGSEAQTRRNLLLTMTIGGFWHGANWTYLVWGMLHGLGLIVERWRGWAQIAALRGAVPSLNGTVRVWLMRAAVFHVVCLAWVFFRAPDLGAAITMLKGAFVLDWRPELAGAFAYLAVFSIPMLLLDLSNERRQEEFPLQKAGLPVQIAVGGSLAAAVMLLAGISPHAFIYFQF